MSNEKECKRSQKSKLIKRLKYISLPAAVLAISVAIIFSLFNPFSPGLSVNAQDLMKGISPAKVDSAMLSDDFVKSTADFSIDLFKKSLTKGESSLVSPTSVFLALGMTANGASGETLKEFETLLGRENITMDDTNRYYHSYAKNLTDVKTGKVSLANSIWYRQDDSLTVNKNFLQTNADYYDASAYKADFSSPQTVKDINNWVSFNTGNLIDKIVDQIDPLTQIILINTFYFDCKWEEKYNKASVQSADFHLTNAKSVFVPFMYSSENVYIQDDKAQGFIKPYLGNKYSFVALLPNKGISADSYTASLTGEKFLSIINHKLDLNVHVALPKFKAEYSKDLIIPLKAIGLKTCFDSGKADFSKMGTCTDGNFFIGEILHKTFIQVDEQGTKAAAATKASTNAGAAPPDKMVILDRPFVYAIIDNETKLPLFIGTMQNPQ